MLSLCLAAVAVVLQQGATRTIEIWSDAPIAVTIEHLTIDSDGRAHMTGDSRLTVGAPLALTYESGEGRYVRFSYEGVSPHTYSTVELGALNRLRLPDALPGGELLLLVPPATVRPVALEIEGPRVQTVHPGGAQYVSLAGLPEGGYRVVPVYEGGIKGRARTYDVQTARSSIAAMPIEAVGTADIVAEAAVCAGATEVLVDMVVPAAGASRTPPPRARVLRSDEPHCELIVAGLPPGTFQVSYRTSRTGTGRTTFEIAPQAVSRVLVRGPSVTVTGRVTLNGDPIADATLVFLFLGSADLPSGSRSETRSDGAGFYSVTLESAGRYQTSFLPRESGFFSANEQATFVDGANTFDISLTGGTITVGLEGWDRRTPIDVKLVSSRHHMQWRWQGRPSVFGALSPGDYEVTLAGPDGTVLGLQTVTLTSARPRQTVRFDLRAR